MRNLAVTVDGEMMLSVPKANTGFAQMEGCVCVSVAGRVFALIGVSMEDFTNAIESDAPGIEAKQILSDRHVSPTLAVMVREEMHKITPTSPEINKESPPEPEQEKDHVAYDDSDWDYDLDNL